jgi:hypothetical protein
MTKKKIINYLRNFYSKINPPKDSLFFSPLIIDKTGQVASDYIKELINGDKPVMIARYGSTELCCVVEYLNSTAKYKYLKWNLINYLKKVYIVSYILIMYYIVLKY